MLTKIVLAVAGLIFVGYGLACAFDPSLPANYIGYQLLNEDARVEVIAMYGGLQMGLGLFCFFGLINAAYSRSALWMIVCMVGGLALTRGMAYTLSDGMVTVYTTGALAFEWITTLLAIVCLYLSRHAEAA